MFMIYDAHEIARELLLAEYTVSTFPDLKAIFGPSFFNLKAVLFTIYMPYNIG